MAELALSLKELAVILVIAAVIFRLARPIALRFTAPADFARRRNVWIALTVAAFLSPNFPVFAAIAIPVMVVAGLKDSAPAALYVLLLNVIPPITFRVPMIGLGSLVDVDIYLLLSFFVLTPVAIRLLRSRQRRLPGLGAMDACLLAYGALQAVLYLHPQNPDGTMVMATATDDVRRAVVFVFATAVPYFVVSRTSTDRRVMLDVLGSFCLACALMAAMALFEVSRHWLLYGEVGARWGHTATVSLYTARNGSVRAVAATGNALVLGYLLAMAFGCWLYLRRYVPSASSRVAVTVLLWLGLLATYSRGPWIGAVFLYVLYALLRPGGMSAAMKALGVLAMVAVVIGLTPLRERIMSVLPLFGGQVAHQSIEYRQRLFDRSWQIIQDNLLLGDQYALLRMEDLRQGQGIIDVVNTYLQIALGNGLVGLALFVSFIGIGLAKAWRACRRLRGRDPELSLLGVTLVACALSGLLMLENVSFIYAIEKIFYVIAGLAAGYVGLTRTVRQRAALADAAAAATGSRLGASGPRVRANGRVGLASTGPGGR